MEYVPYFYRSSTNGVWFLHLTNYLNSNSISYHSRHVSMTSSGINEDGSLKYFKTPQPTSASAIASSSGDIESLRSLSSNELFQLDEHGNNALIWAANSGHDSVVRYLLDIIEKEGLHSGLINTKGYLGNTALSRAARGGFVECVQHLLDFPDIDPNICNEKTQYPLHFAAFKKHPDVVRVMLASGKCDTMVKDRKGRTPAEDTSVEEIKDMILSARGSALR